MADQVIYISKWVPFSLKRAGIVFSVCLLIGCMINFFSPSVTWTLDPNYRLEFWVTLCFVGGVGIFFSDLLLEYTLVNWHAGLKFLLQTISGTVAVLIPLYVIYDLQDLPSIPRTILFVWAVMALIVAGSFSLRQMFEKPAEQAPNPDAKQALTGRAAILSRLPVHLQDAELYALSAEDHYVRVQTSKGDDILLMRLSDSIGETSGVEGMQTHRSWWVAKDAVVDIKKLGRSGEITLKNKKIVPVSRSALKTLKDIGWI